MDDHMLTTKAWPYVEARKLADRNITGPVIFETGYGPSGLPHIGTFAEVARTTMVRHAYEDIMGYGRHQNTRLIVFSDDMDALRKVPDDVPNKDMLNDWIGYSLTRVPDPFDTHESFAHHNNAMLRDFLDRFEFDYEFMSSTDCYQSGMFNDALLKMDRSIQKVHNIILPTLGGERQGTYSAFMPITPDGRVIDKGVTMNPKYLGVVDFEDLSYDVRNGNCKMQWKADWALRWLALGVHYEMAGKDLTDSITLSSKIVRALGGRPPVNMVYELFLDEDGHKISKSKGNGLTIDEWLRYGSTESLQYYLYREPQRAKKLFARLVPTAMDEYDASLTKLASQDAKEALGNPVSHFAHGEPVGVSYQLVLNIASTAAPESVDVLLSFVLKSAPDSPELRAMVEHAFAYYTDHLRGNMERRPPTDLERDAFDTFLSGEGYFHKEGIGRLGLRYMPDDLADEHYQYWVYEVGKQFYGKENLREWFKAIYQTLLGQDSGPRFGTFIQMYGRQNTVALIEGILEYAD